MIKKANNKYITIVASRSYDSLSLSNTVSPQAPSMATTEIKKPKEKDLHKELSKNTLEPVSDQTSLIDHVEVSSDPSTQPSSLQPSAGIPVTVVPPKEGEESKKTGVEASLGSPITVTAPVSDLQKKIRRAERFGVSVQLSEKEKRNSRAERFGSGPSLQGTDELKKSEEQKRKAGAERFGLPAESVSDEEAKKKARLARFGAVTKKDTLEEDKKKARAIRFSQPPSSASSETNGKSSSEQKTIVGKASGGS